MDINIIGRRESLILTAIDIISELGFQGLSVREVAKREKISNATMFNHFKSKNDLIHAVLEHFTQFDDAIINSIRSCGRVSLDAIRYFIESFATYYENYPEITAINQDYEVLRCEAEFSEEVKSILFSRVGYVRQMIDEAKAMNQIRNDIDSEYISDIIIGSFRMICLKWRMENYSFPLKDRILYTVNAVLDSFAPR